MTVPVYLNIYFAHINWLYYLCLNLSLYLRRPIVKYGCNTGEITENYRLITSHLQKYPEYRFTVKVNFWLISKKKNLLYILKGK